MSQGADSKNSDMGSKIVQTKKHRTGMDEKLTIPGESDHQSELLSVGKKKKKH